MVRAAGVPFLPVNSQRIDGDEFVNDHLSRAFQIRARVKASLLFEGFIVFNTTYATGMNTQAMPFSVLSQDGSTVPSQDTVTPLHAIETSLVMNAGDKMTPQLLNT